MAEIFLAVSMDDGVISSAPMVLKRVLPHLATEPSFIKMFANEAAFCIRLEHPNIIRSYDYGQAEENHYLTMEYVPGQDVLALNQYTRRSSERLPPELAAYICQKVALGLHHAHELRNDAGESLGLVHRDVTPENIQVGYDGSVRLLDFGIARAKGHTSETRSGVLKGKVGYVAPEQALGRQVDRRSDIFSLGIVAHELFTGQRLFDGLNEFVVLERLRTEAIPPPSALAANIPLGIDDLVVAATQRDPDLRLPNAATFASRLAELFPQATEEKCKTALKRWIRGSFATKVAHAEMRADDYSRYEVLPDGQIVQHAPPPEDATSQWDLSSDGTEDPQTIAMRRLKPTEVSILGGRLDGTPPPDLSDLQLEAESGPLSSQQTPSRNFLDLPSSKASTQEVEEKTIFPVAIEGTPTPATTIDLSHPFAATSSRASSEYPQTTEPGTPSMFASVLVILLGALLGLVAAYALIPETGPSTKGTLVVRVHPSDGIAVHLDGKLIAERAPLVIQGISFGQHRISVERPGYGKFLKTFDYDATQEAFLDIDLKPISQPTAKIQVKSPVRRSKLTIDDQDALLNQMITIPANTPVRLELASNGYETVRLEANLKPGERRDFLMNPEPVEGTLIVETRPPGTAYLNGTPKGRTPTTIRGLDVNRTWSLTVKGKRGKSLSKTIRFGTARLVTVDEALRSGRR